MITFLFFLIIAIAQLSLGLSLPSLPEISELLHFNEIDEANYTLYFLCGIFISQVFVGFLFSRLSKFKLIILGLTIFLFGSTLTISPCSGNVFLLGRAIQGVGVGSSTVLVRALLKDFFSGKQYLMTGSKLYSYNALIPAVSPVIGAFIYVYFGVNSAPYLLSLITLVVILLLLINRREFLFTERKDRLEANYKTRCQYFSIIKNKTFLGLTVVSGLIYSGEIVFISRSQTILQKELLETPVVAGSIVTFTIFGFFIGAQLSKKIVTNKNIIKIIHSGVFICLLSSVLGFGYKSIPINTSIVIFFTMSLYMFGAGLVYINASLLAISEVAKFSGVASSLLSIFQGALVLIVANTKLGISMLDEYLVIQILCSLLALLIIICLVKKRSEYVL